MIILQQADYHRSKIHARRRHTRDYARQQRDGTGRGGSTGLVHRELLFPSLPAFSYAYISVEFLYYLHDSTIRTSSNIIFYVKYINKRVGNRNDPIRRISVTRREGSRG